MRGVFSDHGRLFSYISPEGRVPANHPLRKIRNLVRDVLGELNRSLTRLYASEGRPSIPPEQLLSALLLQMFYGIRSERQLMEQLDFNLPTIPGFQSPTNRPETKAARRIAASSAAMRSRFGCILHLPPRSASISVIP